MINIIIPVIDDVEKFSAFVEKKLKKDVRFFVGICESKMKSWTLRAKNVELHVFNDKANKEEIINSLHSCKLVEGKILIARRALTDDEFLKITSSQSDIVTLKAKHNRFVETFKKLARTIVRKFFAFNFFEDISAICYGESMFDLISVCSNLSMASRVNKYVGVSTEEIETEEKQVKKAYNRHLNNLYFSLWTILFAGSVAGGVLLCIFTPLYALTVIGVMFWIIVTLMLWLVGLVNFTRTIAVGDLRYGRAEELVSEQQNNITKDTTEKKKSSQKEETKNLNLEKATVENKASPQRAKTTATKKTSTTQSKKTASKKAE